MEPPSISCPQDIFVTSGDGIILDDPIVEDEFDSAPMFNCNPVLQVYPEGRTEITCTTIDVTSNEGNCTYDITVGKNKLLIAYNVFHVKIWYTNIVD